MVKSEPEPEPGAASDAIEDHRLSVRTRQAIDTAVYAVAVAAVTTAAGGLLSLAVGGGWLVVEYVMFIIGFLQFGYGTYLLYPEQRWKKTVTDDGEVRVEKRTDGEVVGSREVTPFQRLLQHLPPLSQVGLPPEDRLSRGLKLFVASFLVLAVSFGIERLFVV